jgi:hypothetical protein
METTRLSNLAHEFMLTQQAVYFAATAASLGHIATNISQLGKNVIGGYAVVIRHLSHGVNGNYSSY